MSDESLMPERDEIWAKHDGLTPALAAEMLAFAGKMEMERNQLAKAIDAATVLIAAKGRHNTMLAYEGLREALEAMKGGKP